MKPNHHYFILFAAFFIFSCQPSDSTDSAELLITAARADQTPQIDGRLDEPAYQRAEKIHLKNSATTEAITDEAYTTTVQALYDDGYLYLGYVCGDKDIHSSFTQRDERLWEEEVVEVFIDTDGSTPNSYVEIEVSPKNVLYDSYIVDPKNIDEKTKHYDLEDIHTGVFVDGTTDDRTDEDRRWTIEIAVPFSEIEEGFDPSKLSDYHWKINFYRINQDEHGPAYFAWSPTEGSFHKPERFGEIMFR
jgi:hypothetical protein